MQNTIQAAALRHAFIGVDLGHPCMKSCRRVLGALTIALLGLLLVSASAAQAAIIIVVNTSDGAEPGPAGSLRRAISAASTGDTIDFAAGLATINLTSGELLINKNLTINGPGANLLSVQRSSASGTPAFRIFDIASASISVTLSGLTIANGSAGGGLYGGGILNYGTLALANSTLSGNSALVGGGIYNSNGTLTVANTTLSGNTTTNTGFFGGGGIYNIGTLTVTSTTLSGNTATTEGGGIYSYTSTLTITDSTLSGNSAGSYGGGIRINAGTANSRNTIIAKNAAASGPDVSGALTSQGFNLIGDSSGATISVATADQIGNAASPIDPLLGPLQDNGGPTRTRALLSGSTAIDKGHSGGLVTDQRGFARPVDSPVIANAGDGSDIGAYEVQPDQLLGCSAINRIVNNNADAGTGSLRDVIASVCGGSTITFAANVRGAINLTSAELPINKNLTINGPGANLLSVQRVSTSVAPAFRIFNLAPGINATLSGLTIANGNTPGNGGGITNAGMLTIDAVAVTGNIANLGAGIWNQGNLNVRNSTIASNVASAAGGGVGNSSGDLYATGSTIAFNTASYGGGLVNYSNMVVVNSTIAGNEALTNGGGIYAVASTSTANVYNSTIAYNDADYNRSGYSGGGIFVEAGSATFNLRNTLVAGNTVGNSPLYDDCTGTLHSYGRNLFWDVTGCTVSTGSGSWTYLNSLSTLSPFLQNHGGPTMTVALLSGSNAIDGGDPLYGCIDSNGNTLPTDQRGFARVVGTYCDVGAFEYNDAIFANGFD